MDSLKGILSDLRVFLYTGIQTLPLTLSGTMLLLGLFTANYAMLFFLAGFLVFVPLVNHVLNMGLIALLPDAPYLKVRTGDVCSLVTPLGGPSQGGESDKHVMSQWMAMVSFFFGYMFHNSVKLMMREPEPTGSVEVSEKEVKEQSAKASYRKTQALVSLLSLIVVSIVIFILRYRTGCESIVGFIVALLGYGTAGYFWYYALSSVGQDRLSDLFGMANRLLAPGAIASGPVVCMPS